MAMEMVQPSLKAPAFARAPMVVVTVFFSASFATTEAVLPILVIDGVTLRLRFVVRPASEFALFLGVTSMVTVLFAIACSMNPAASGLASRAFDRLFTSHSNGL